MTLLEHDLAAGTSRRVDELLNRLFPSRQMDRVLLVNPPDADASLFRIGTAKRGRYTNYPPYGLMVIAANLRQMGVTTDILNLNHEVLGQAIAADSEFEFDTVWRRRLRAKIDEFQPDLVGVTCMFTMTHEAFKQVCLQVADREIPLAVGGVHVTNDLERVLSDVGVIDIAFTHEGDRAVRNFVQAVRGERDSSASGQVVLIDREADGNAGRHRLNSPAQPTAEEMNVMPAHDLVDFPAYSQAGKIGSFYFLKPKHSVFATSLSNRGCRAQCTFCSVRNFNGAGVRARSIDSVIEELKCLRFDHGVDHIMWLDDDLCYDSKRAIRLFDAMVRNKLDLTWDATNGVLAASCTDDLVAAAAESGCIALNIGMESGNAEILKAVKKPANVDVLLRAAEVLRRYEQIHASVFLMLGFPNETMSMIWDTMRVAREMDLDWYRISQLQPLPNTPIYDAMLAQGLIRSTDSSEVRYKAGAYGKQNELEEADDLSQLGFQEAFSVGGDEVPGAEQLTDIWFFMNYHLNFDRLFHERRPAKIEQLHRLLSNLSDVVAPEHGFALYFLGYLQYKVTGHITPSVIQRLEQRLQDSSYWNDRFRAFGLSVEDLRRQTFPKESAWARPAGKRAA